ncbi:MAG: S9 family peptidase [Thermoanaerobaculia bacterium]
MSRRFCLALLLVLVAAVAQAERRALTLERVYDPKTKENFSGIPQRDFTWIDDWTFIWPKTEAAEEAEGDDETKVSEYVIFDVRTGKEEPLLDRSRLREAILEIAEVEEEDAERHSSQRELELNEARDAILLTIDDDLYFYSIPDGELVRLTKTEAEEKEPVFSPDGASVSFIRDNDLYVVGIADRKERRLTTSGSPELLNGILDWVYQEEIYGRGDFQAHWWSPDSSTIAYLQLDEKPVPEFTVIDDIPYDQDLEVTNYPQAGDSNPIARLLVVDVESGESRPMDLSRYADDDFLIVNVAWSGNGGEVVYQIQNREQTWLDLNFADRATGESRVLFRETTPAWVDVHGSPEWLEDGTFLWFSERTGYKHLYHYRPDGTLIRQITEGRWEVRTLHGIDEKNAWIYVSGTERSWIGSDVYRVRLDGSDLTRLSSREGTHTASFSPNFVHFLDTWSDVNTPHQVRLHRAGGKELRVIDANPVSFLETDLVPRPDFLQVETRDGFVMEAMLFKPPDFDPSRKYPVYQHVYGGPHAQQVRNAWTETHLFHRLLAQNGILVWICDNRTASGKGAVSTWPVYQRFGETELADIEDGLAWLRSQPWVDGSRIMINGWSYGGFMTSYALTHSDSFVAGIAGGTVADWRDYDTIYTERFMRTPQNNEEGYRDSSPRFDAADLSGNLLLIHGAIDDNVHVQNTMQFAWELQKAGKPFRMMLYPKARHGVRNDAQVYHMRRMMLDFILENLKP